MKGPAFALDSSCMVATVCTWHENHGAAVASIERRLDRGERLAVAAHALVETYAVLTRLPAPHRLAPADAWTLVKANFVDSGSVVALSSQAHIRCLERLAAARVGGGRSYDALIAASVAQAGVLTLLTLNPRHFDPSPEGVEIVDPTEES